MRPLSKVLAKAFVLVFFLYALAWVPSTRCQLPDIDEKALTYVENVLPIDLTHYQITNHSYQLPEMPNATYRTDAVTFTLNSSDSFLFVNCMFRDGVQYTCDMRVQAGSPAYTCDCSNLIEMAKLFVEGHQSQSGVDCSYLLKTLEEVTTADNVTSVSLGNVKLTVSRGMIPVGGLIMVNGSLHVDPSKMHGITSFIWACEEGVIFFIDFENGHLHSLRDERIINNFTITPFEESPQGEVSKEEMEQSESATSIPLSDGTGVYENKEHGSSESTFSLLVMFAGASALGIAASIGLTFHIKKRGAVRKVDVENQIA